MGQILILGAALACSSGWTAGAQAQTAQELSDARALFQKAIELEQAENWTQALKAFREVGQVRMTPQVRYHIAVCEENLGQLAAALGGYEIALSQGEGLPPAFLAEVSASIEDLNARIPKLVLLRGSGADAAQIELDGIRLGEAQVGVELPLNPGPHTVVARAPGYQDLQATVTVNESTVETLTLELAPIVVEAPPEEPPPPPPAPKSFGILPYVVGGAGAGVVVVGGVLLGVSQGKASQVEALCGGTDCRALSGAERSEALQKRRSALGLETAGWVGVSLGVSGLATGAVMYFIDRKRLGQAEEAGWTAQAQAPGAEAGFSLSCLF